MEERQPGLDEGAGHLVQAAQVVAGRVAAVQLGLEQDQVDQADELLRGEPQHELIRFVLQREEKQSVTPRGSLAFVRGFSILLDGSFDRGLARFVGCDCRPRGNPERRTGLACQTSHVTYHDITRPVDDT